MPESVISYSIEDFTLKKTKQKHSGFYSGHSGHSIEFYRILFCSGPPDQNSGFRDSLDSSSTLVLYCCSKLYTVLCNSTIKECYFNRKKNSYALAK